MWFNDTPGEHLPSFLDLYFHCEPSGGPTWLMSRGHVADEQSVRQTV